MKYLLVFFVIFAIFPSVEAATIHGQVFAWDTFRELDAIIEINSVPNQQDIIKIGEEYRFTVSPGKYTITGFSSDGSYKYSENITINDDGDYVLDLVLFDALIDDPIIEPIDDPGEFAEDSSNLLVYVVILVVLLVIFMYVFMRRMYKNDEVKRVEEEVLSTDENLEKVLAIVKELDGRVTQKDIRKRMLPLSEAKVSLLITELEDKGVVKRIKKGRGNVIILVKRN